MWSERLKKILSFFLICSLLFSITLRVPFVTLFGGSVYAEDKEFYNLVSIIVDEESYDEIKSELVRYSRDIQKSLENTRVVILPTPSDASVIDIASLNESLYFEGYKSHKNVDFESRLIGTVLVGKIPVPIVFDGNNSAKSLLPYIDFEDKAFIFDHKSGRYEKNTLAENEYTPELWHGVISPNTGSQSSDVEAMKDYFDKNNDFYRARGLFDQESGVLDGTQNEVDEDYEPYVFYYDQFRENEAIQYQKYIGYEMYLQNLEDITYNRFSKELAERIKNQVLGVQSEEIVDLIQKVDPSFDISGLGNGPNVESSSDIATRYITNNSTKKFLEIFNGSTLGDMRKHVYNAGRYNKGGSKVNVDIPPFLISVLDEVSAEVIKNVNTSLENNITQIVSNGLSRKIAIPVSQKSSPVIQEGFSGVSCGGTNTTFYYGLPATDITSAAQCSIYRGSSEGSGTLVASNRGYNVDNTNDDSNLCALGIRYENGEIIQGLSGFWGGNSPINLSQKGSNYSDLQLGDHSLKGGIRPVYDILGSKETLNNSRIPSPLDCYTEGIQIQTYRSEAYLQSRGEQDVWVCGEKFNLPIHEGDPLRYWSSVPNGEERGTTHESRFCAANNITTPTINFDTSLAREWNGSKAECHIRSITFDGRPELRTHRASQTCTGGEGSICVCPSDEGVFSYKSIPSYILHTSPTDEEFGAQVQSLFTPSLPIDSDRYIDFIGAKSGTQAENYGYQRIDFPQLFRVAVSEGEDLSLEFIESKIKDHLDEVSAQINEVIQTTNPSGLTGRDKELYTILQTGPYPEADIDLYNDLTSRPLEIFSSDNDAKEISYFDTLVFAVYWNNLKTVSSKYKFIFEEYLSDQFSGNDYNFHLPKNKKSYEIAYLGAPGDAQNMYIKLDPQGKALHPYSEILSQNLELQSILSATNITMTQTSQGTFACAPPDGVPIWQWIPAVTCWLGEMLPPNFGPSHGACGGNDFFLSQEERQELASCSGDLNKNGVNDCIESKLGGGTILLESDAGRYYYNTSGVIRSKLKDTSGNIVNFDNSSSIDYELLRLEIPRDPSEIFGGENIQVLYDSEIPELSGKDLRERASSYINFRDITQKVQRGTASTFFSSKSSDVNAYFRASVETLDASGNKVIDIESDLLMIEIRGDSLFLESHIHDDEGVVLGNTLTASDTPNISLFDLNIDTLPDSSNVDGEELLIGLKNNSRAGSTLNINYPLEISLEREGEIVYSESGISQENIKGGYKFFTGREAGEYELKVTDSSRFQTTKRIDILPDIAASINTTLSTTLVESGGNVSTHLVTIVDSYGNPVRGDIYTLDIDINGNGVVFEENDTSKISYEIVEGYKAFRLKSTQNSTDNVLVFSLKDATGEEILSSQDQIRSIDSINIDLIALDGTPEVGGEEYRYDLSFVDRDGKLLSGLNSRVYLGMNSLYGRVQESYSEVVGGKAKLAFTTSTLAANNIELEFQLEGGNNIYKTTTDILPGAPVKLDLHVNRDQIEASPDDSSTLQVTLKDRYNNEVFNDSQTEVILEIAQDSENIISSNNSRKTLNSGRTQFELRGTNTPGIGYFQVSTSPDLSENSFTVIGQKPFIRDILTLGSFQSDGELTESGQEFFRNFSDTEYISVFPKQEGLLGSQAYRDLPEVLQGELLEFWQSVSQTEFSGVSQNAGSIETFFFWDKDNIAGNAYNSIYSVLWGAPYGDISQENYLGGSLLFDRNNRSLAVSSLLESPQKFHDVVSLGADASIQGLLSDDISQDIDIRPNIDQQGRITFEIVNEALNTYIGKIYYNLSNNVDITLRLSNDRDYNIGLNGGNTQLKNSAGKTLFEVSEDGLFTRAAGIEIRMDMSYNGAGLALMLFSGQQNIARVIIEDDLEVNVTRNTRLLENKLQTLSGTVIVHIVSNQYATRELVSDQKASETKIYYVDPFNSPSELNDFARNSENGFENSQRQEGIGWQDENTMLLSFAAGESVGESSKFFQSFSLINLGDPVVSLKSLDVNFSGTSQKKSFDSTLGSLIIDDDSISGYRTFDYNNDQKPDILTIHRDGYMKLYEQFEVSGDYIFQQNLIYSNDSGGHRLVQTGDFTGDGYDDVFFVTDSGEPQMFLNSEKDFVRIDLVDQLELVGSIIQSESYDMDNDGIDDLITLDDAGDIHIFYGGVSSGEIRFTKNKVGNSYGVILSDSVFRHGGVLYFDEMIKVDRENSGTLQENTGEFISALRERLDNNEEVPEAKFIDESFVNNLLYVPVSYNTRGSVINSSSAAIDQLGEGYSDLTELQEEYGEYVSFTGLRQNTQSSNYFLRSEYADLQGLEVTKNYRDIDGDYLQNGDSIYFDITLKNISSENISNIAYLDKLPEYFSFLGDEYEILGDTPLRQTRKKSIGTYNIVVDGFSLTPGEERSVRFELVSLPISYGDMQVGLHESGEIGDDSYGDILLKEDTKNCGAVADIYRSTSQRGYQEGTTKPSCDSENIDIGNTHPNLVDRDVDGIPDYLQNILDSNDPDDLRDYAEDTLRGLNIDSDADGVPDSDDALDTTHNATDFMGALSQIDEVAEEISADVDVLIEGLSCGFGGGSCIATPLNWAPLAPGNDPTLFGRPVGDGLKVGEGRPIFSALTGRQTSCGTSPCCIPSVYPATSQAFVPGPVCGPSSAGGSLGTWAPTNFVRIFASPTLTGGFGTAVCFGGPAIVAGNSNPQGVHPIIPGGNCIVTAQPITSCEGGEGDPSVLGYPYLTSDFGVIHANCQGAIPNPSSPAQLRSDFVREYFSYQETGVASEGLYDDFVQTLRDVSENSNASYHNDSTPIGTLGSGEEEFLSSSLSFDSEALASGNLRDVVQVENTRIAGFPGFLMDWVERQLDEITSKLTKLPKVFVILPDLSGVIGEGWSDFQTGFEELQNSSIGENTQAREALESERKSLIAYKSSLDCSGADTLECTSVDLQLRALQGKSLFNTGNKQLSGIKQVYSFLSSVPLVNIETETIPVNIPWIEPNEINKFVQEYRFTRDQWADELKTFQQNIQNPDICGVYSGDEARACELKLEAYADVAVDAEALISSLEANISILEEYKEFPDQLSKIINTRERWLYQILCNIDAISGFIGEWISSNGERFKAWVELYILIKSILKSWQVFIDIFNGYEAECHECKNERQDLQNFTFELIGSILPSAPIIEFPKWPDIVLDLHNVRAGIDIVLPEFELQTRPIILPTLPELSLPDFSFSASTDGGALYELNIDIPELPSLPRFSLPELPDLPGLPTIELPDLPPPLKIPKLFGAVEGMLNIVKLITKVMCILKNSPFVPEWRAGDQIAFLTERNGYLPTDFINIQAPKFSYSAVSEIRVTSFVNFEFETDFIVEAVRSIMAPFDSVSSNIVNLFNIELGDIEVISTLPTDLNIDISPEGIDSNISLAPLSKNPEGIYFVAALIATKAQELLVHLSDNREVALSNEEFIRYIGGELASLSITSNPRTKELQSIWTEVFSLTYSKEKKFIEELQKNNTEKFETLGNILSTEIEYLKKQQESLDELVHPSSIIRVSSHDSLDVRAEGYNEALSEYNEKAITATKELLSRESDPQRQEITKAGEALMSQLRGGLQNYKENTLLAVAALPEDTGNSRVPSGGSCQSSGAYNYHYEGMYVTENNRNYKLFDYTEILTGDETPHILDMDMDGDDDVMYLASGKVYFKENRKNTKDPKEYISGPPLILNTSDNKFYGEDPYYEALNGFKEVAVSDGSVNIEFQKPSRDELSHFVLEYNTIVDRYMDTRDSFVPNSVEKHIVDARDISKDFQSSDTILQVFPHPATLTYVGAMNGLKLNTPKLINIRNNLVNNTLVTLTPNTFIYAGNRDFLMSYRGADNELRNLQIGAYESVRFTETVEIEELGGDAYVASSEYEVLSGTDIIEFIGKPLLPGSHINFEGDRLLLDPSSHVDVRYPDGSERQFDMREITSYHFYDLSNNYGEEYRIRLDIPNDFYYGIVSALHEGVYSTQSKQVLLSPQSQNDVIAPQIGLNKKIRVPVYQRYDLDITPYIFEDGGVSGISDIWLDMNIELDSDGDGVLENDRDSENIEIRRTPGNISLIFGPYEEIVTRNIRLFLEDDNRNLAVRNLELEVYTPIPAIEEIENNTIRGNINEDLSEEPVSLYRYRGGVLEKLVLDDGRDIVPTDDFGNYAFEASGTGSGVILTHAGRNIATINEFSGDITLMDALSSLQVIPSNNAQNTSLYPEIRILVAGQPVFRQFIKIPEGEPQQVGNFNDIRDVGVYIGITDQENYSSYRVPLGAPYNPGSLSLYLTSDRDKTPVMTVFQDGRINIDESRYRLGYASQGAYKSLLLIQKGTNKEIAQVLYSLEGSYILR